MKKTTALFAAAVAVCALVAWPAVMDACVGKTLYLGRLPGREQEILAEIFVWLVSERTGTSIEVKSFPDSRASHNALEKAKIDLYLEEPFVALREILQDPLPEGEADAARQLVRKEYEKRFNFIWLEPWGALSKAAPVVRRDTLKKFPALSRLVNKMAGVLDDQTMKALVAESTNTPVRQVAKTFLKQKKLI